MVQSCEPRLSGQAGQTGLQWELTGNSGEAGRPDWSLVLTADSEEAGAGALLAHLPPSEAADQEVLTAAPCLTPGAAPHSRPPGAQPGEQEVLGHGQVDQQQTHQHPDSTNSSLS